MPKIIQPLFKEDAYRIKRNWKFLKSNLLQNDIRDDFMVEDIWDLPDFEKIDAEKTTEEKNEVFLKLLLQSGEKAYKVFIAGKQSNPHSRETSTDTDYRGPSRTLCYVSP